MPTAYGTVAGGDASELALADEVDLNAGGLKRGPGSASASRSGGGGSGRLEPVETLKATVLNASWRADTIRETQRRVNELSSRLSTWWAGASPKERMIAGGGAGFAFVVLLMLLSPYKPTEVGAKGHVVGAGGVDDLMSSSSSNSHLRSSSNVHATLDGNGHADHGHSQHLEFKQLPCFSGSCDNWLFRANGGSDAGHHAAMAMKNWTDAECNALSRKFGCGDCKSAHESAQYAAFGPGRVTLCPKDTPAPSVVQTMDAGPHGAGCTYMAVKASQYAQELRSCKLPCWSGSCDHYLLESDAHDFLASNHVCNYWASKLGCANCMTAAQVAADVRLQAFSTNLPAGRPKTGRTTMCRHRPDMGKTVSSDGIQYMVHRDSFWTQDERVADGH